MASTQFHPYVFKQSIVGGLLFAVGLFVVSPMATTLASDSVSLQVVQAQAGMGQFGEFDFRPDESLFLPVPREQSIRIERIRTAAEDRRWTDAAQELASILSDSEYEDYVTRSEVGKPASESLKAYVSGMMSELPNSVWDAYQLLVGAEARALLDKGLETQDQEKLGEVVRRYLHTEAGEKASVILARLLMDRRQWEGAYLLLGKLESIRPNRRQLVMESEILKIVCQASSGDRQAALQNMESFLERHGANNRLFPEAVKGKSGQPEELLEQLVRLHTSLGQRPFTWMHFQGDATRNAQSRGSEPLREIMWNVRLAHSRQEQEGIQKAKQRLIDNQLPVIPAIQPLVVQDQVIFRTPNSLLATDVRNGKILWKFPWDSLDSETSEPLTSDPSFNAGENGDLLEYAIWADSARGHLSSDGKRVFFVHEDPMADGSALRVGNANFMLRATRQLRQNSLMSLDINREGATVWMLGNSEDDDGEGLSGARFLGPPLPVDGQLFALARIIDETRLLSLDPETGSVLWSQQLSHSPAQQDMTTDFSLAASPSYHGGILICPTNAGVIVAIDTVSRTILWGFQYKEIERARNNRRITINSRSNNQDESLFGNRWTDGTPLIQGSRVLVTPPDSDELHCLDLLTGKLLWTRPRDNGLTIACIEDGVLLQINSDSLLGIDVATGEPAWSEGENSLLPEGTAPSGYGFRREGTYFLPTTQETILPVDIKSGEFGEPIASGGQLGNLVCYDQFVLAVSPEYVTAFKQIDALRREVETRLASNPDDAEALRHQGSLRLHDGKLTDALASLQRSYKLEAADETRHALVSTGLAALRADFENHQDLVTQLESLVETAEDRLLLARLKATGRHHQGQTLEAFEAYLEFADLAEVLLEPAQSADRLRLDSLEPDLKADYSRVLRGYMVELEPTAEAAELEKIESTLQERLDDIAKGEEDEALRLHRFATYFHPFDVAREARIRRAARLLEDGPLLEAEIALRGLFADQVSPQHLASLSLALAERLETEQLPRQAAQWYDLLINRYAEIQVDGQRPVSEVLAEKSWYGRPGTKAEAEPRWGYQNYVVRTESHEPIIARQNYAIRLRELNRIAPSGFGIRLDNQSNQFLINDSSGELTVRIPFTTESGKQLYNPQIGAVYAQQLGHLLAVSLGDEIQVFDALPRPDGASEERLLWSVQLQNEVPGGRGRTARITAKSGENPFGERVTKANDGGKPIGQFCLNADGTLIYQHGAKVVCADPIDGTILWERDRIPIGSQLICSDRYVAAIAPGRSNSAGPDVKAILLSIENGTLVREHDLPDPLRIWTDCQGTLVCWRETSLADSDSRTYEIQGIDVETGKMLWKRQPTDGAQAAILNRRDQLAILDPSGAFEVLRLADGETQFKDQLESGPVQQIKILEGFDDIFLFAYREFEKDRRLHFRGVPHDTSESVFKGEVYAFNATTGDRLWDEPARVSDTYFVESLQPIELPVLTFVTRLNRPIEGSSQSKPVLSALILDRRDGRILFRGEFDESSVSYSVSGDPDKDEITVRFDSQSVRLKASADDPRAPAPPAANAPDFRFPPDSAPQAD